MATHSFSDATFAVSRDETSNTYATGATSLGAATTLRYASPFACNPASVSVSQLTSGSDTFGGIANLNLSGTAFAVTGGNPCGSAYSCSCSGTGSGNYALTCPGFTAGIWGSGSGAALYIPAAQSVIIRADGACGWFYPYPSPTLVPLDGTVLLTQPSCGGIPCGYGGSSCWQAQVM